MPHREVALDEEPVGFDPAGRVAVADVTGAPDDIAAPFTERFLGGVLHDPAPVIEPEGVARVERGGASEICEKITPGQEDEHLLALELAQETRVLGQLHHLVVVWPPVWAWVRMGGVGRCVTGALIWFWPGVNPVFTLICEPIGMEQTPHLPLNKLADALGDVRAEIRSLRAREAVLRQAVIDARPNGAVTGHRYELVVRENERRVFDRDSLPNAILHDDRFWMKRTSRTVITRASDPALARGGEPAASPAPATCGGPASAPTLDLWGQESDLVLIEEI